MRALPHPATRALVGSLTLSAVMVACRTSASTETPAPVPAAVPAGLADAEVAEAEVEAPVLLEGSTNEIRLTLQADGPLTRGTTRGQAEILVIFAELPLPDGEDPANRVQAFVREGDVLRKVWDWTPSGYGPVELEFPGDGATRYTEDGWTACIAAGNPKLAVGPRRREGHPPRLQARRARPPTARRVAAQRSRNTNLGHQQESERPRRGYAAKKVENVAGRRPPRSLLEEASLTATG